MLNPRVTTGDEEKQRRRMKGKLDSRVSEVREVRLKGRARERLNR